LRRHIATDSGTHRSLIRALTDGDDRLRRQLAH